MAVKDIVWAGEAEPRLLELLPAIVVKRKLKFHLANDHRLEIATSYSPTSTYLIGLDGKIKARWLDQIHGRVGGEAIIEAMTRD